MSENPIPATQPEAGAAAGEFNFTKPESENPRIKKRSLKVKPAGLIKPNPAAIASTRELEREAPPRAAEPAKPTSVKTEGIMAKPAAKIADAPPKVTPTASSTPTASPAVNPNTTAKIASTATPTPSANSPHGTRPATLYYSTPTRKAETPSPMKTIPTTSAASSASSSASTATPVSATRVTTNASAPRASSPNVDYRANIERQSREQKSAGSILSFIVYGLIAFFVISAALAAYGANVIFAKLHDQSTTVAELDQHYTRLTDDLSAKLSATQDTLAAAQATITRQQDVITKQGEALNQLLAASNANDAAIKAVKSETEQEKASRAQETANLRARIKELEYKTSQKNF
jgi:Spy/CpxP family protein refolding chaperone